MLVTQWLGIEQDIANLDILFPYTSSRSSQTAGGEREKC
jgi:hypothetical protein